MAISRNRLRFCREYPVIRPGAARFPRRFAPRNDKFGGIVRSAMSPYNLQACKALRERRLLNDSHKNPRGRAASGILFLRLNSNGILARIELVIEAAAGQQLRVRALLDDMAVVEHKDEVGVDNGG